MLCTRSTLFVNIRILFPITNKIEFLLRRFLINNSKHTDETQKKDIEVAWELHKKQVRNYVMNKTKTRNNLLENHCHLVSKGERIAVLC